MLAMGGALKRKEKISGRLGDVLSMMYLVSATLKRYEDQGRIREDLPLVRWAVRDALYRAQQAIDGILSNFPVKPLATLLRWTIFPLGMSFRPPLDSRNRECAQIALEPGAARDRLTAGMYVPEGRTTPPACSRSRVPRRRRLRADRREAARGGEEGKDRAARRDLGCSHGADSSRRRTRAMAAQGSAAQAGHQGRRLPAGFRPRRDLVQLARSRARPLQGRLTMYAKPIYIVDGARTPFLKSKNRPGPFAASDLATQAGRALLVRQQVRARTSSTR